MVMMELFLIYGLTFGSVALAGVVSYLPLQERILSYVRQRSAEATQELSDVFLSLPARTLWLLYALSPLATGLLCWLASRNALVGAGGAAVGVLVPNLIVRQTRWSHFKRFHGQLVDGLLLLSSSLKAGLSMTQAFTVVAEEMPPPISQEFGLILKELRMGVSLEDAMAHLKRRLPIDDVTLFVTAVLVGRETGGDITQVFRRLVETLRERKKLKERIKTLTFMARLQGVLMAMLPVVFAFVVYRIDAKHFQFFLKDPFGQILLIIIVTLQLIGGLLFIRFSRSPL